MSKQKELKRINTNIYDELKRLDEREERVEVHHVIMTAAARFAELSPHIPRTLGEPVQHIHGCFVRALHNIYTASNTCNDKEKIDCLYKAKEEIFFQYTCLEYLVKTKALTVGGANVVITELQKAYEQISKWYTSINK